MPETKKSPPTAGTVTGARAMAGGHLALSIADSRAAVKTRTDSDQAAELLAVLGLNRGLVEVKCFNRAGKVKMFWYDSPDALLHDWPRLEATNATGYGVYFGVATYSKRSGTKDKAAWLWTVHADLDGKDYVADKGDWRKGKSLALDMLATLPDNLQPAVLNDTGHGIHAYWPLQDPLPATPENIAAVEAVNAALAIRLDSDPAVKDVSRVMRLPGLSNINCNWLQDPEPLPVVLFGGIDGRRFELADFEPIMPQKQMPAAETPSPAHSAGVGGTGESTGNRPGDAYNQRGNWLELLEPRGWVVVSESKPGGPSYLRRPGKDAGISARLNRGGDGLLRVYSSNAGALAAGQSYTLFGAYAALEHGGDFRAATKALAALGYGTPSSNGSDPTKSTTTVSDETREDLTDLGNARRLVRLYGQNLRYVEAWGWLAWDGKRWQKDETGAVMRLAKRTALSFYVDATRQHEQAAAATKAAEDASAVEDEGAEKTALDRAKAAQKGAKALTDHAKRCQARSQLENMVKLAQSEPGIPAVPDDFDRDPWLLNVANGLLDLRTGNLRPHDRGALCTKLAPVAYDPAASCPQWRTFLDRIFASDQSLSGFAQRLTGYSLTGSTRDHVLPFCHGRGANGKSTMTGTIMAMMGDYAQKARRSLVTLGRNDDGGPTPDKARLKGARFVVVNETEEGRRLAESDVKDLTGSDRITAAYKYKDPFEFDPTHTLWLYGNGRPQITGTDEGIWRRVKYIPFEVVIPEPERDPHLSEKLMTELPGILAWAVAGCLDWQRGGLREPEKVRKATAAYREEQDVLAAFLADCCIDGPSYQVTATDLYGAYKTWCEETGVKPESQRRLAPRLRERGYKDGERETTGTKRKLWRGLALIGQAVQEALLAPSSEPLREPSEPSEPLFGNSPIEVKNPDIETYEKRFQRFPKVPVTDAACCDEGER